MNKSKFYIASNQITAIVVEKNKSEWKTHLSPEWQLSIFIEGKQEAFFVTGYETFEDAEKMQFELVTQATNHKFVSIEVG